MPVADHPMIPGSSQALKLSPEQFEILQHEQTVFASVVKNDRVLQKKADPIQDLLDPHKVGQENRHDYHLASINELSDVYDVGVLCNARAVNDERNVFPYILYLFPTDKARLASAVSAEEEVASLCRVLVEKIREQELLEEELNVND